MPDPLPCFDCGGEVATGQVGPANSGRWTSVCHDCDAEGPEADTFELAVAAWNGRMAAYGE